MNLNKFITKLLNEVSYRTKEGYPIFSNKEHIEILSEVLSEWGLDSIQSELIQNLLTEKGEVSTSAAKKAKDMGLDHIAFGFYSKNGEKPATHKADGENVVTVSADEFEKVAAEKSGETPASDTKDDTGGEGDGVGGESEPQTGTALSSDTEGGKSYLKSLPDTDPAKPADMKDDSEETMSAGGVVYPLGGGYYADTPNGKPKYKEPTEESVYKGDRRFILETEDEGDDVVKRIAYSGGKSKTLDIIGDKEQQKAIDILDAEKKPDTKKKKRTKNKKLDQNKNTKGEFNEGNLSKDGVTDEQFAANSKIKPTPSQITVEQIEKFFLDENGNTKFPKKYIKVLARMLSTKPSGVTISDFTNPSGAGTAASTMGEILTMMSATIKDDNTSNEFFSMIKEHVKQNGKESIIDIGWVKSAEKVRQTIFKRYDRAYGTGNWELDNMAWDVADEVEALGMENYKQNKGFSTDTYAKVKVNGNYILDEISLKKELKANLLNATSNRVQDIMVRGTATSEDLKQYDDLNAKIEALAGLTDTASKNEKKKLSTQRDAIIEKYNAKVPDEVKVSYTQKTQRELHEKFIQNASAEIEEFFNNFCNKDDVSKTNIATSITNKMNQKDDYVNQVTKKMNDICEGIQSGLSYENVLMKNEGKSDYQKLNLAVMIAIADTNQNSNATTIYNSIVENSHNHSKAVRKFLLEDANARKGLFASIRESFPLKSLFEGEENMILGDVSADRQVLQDVFGVEEFSELEQRLTIRDTPPPPSIVYRVNTKDGNTDIPIAEISSRPDGIGYGGTWKLEMKIHDEFGKKLRESNDKLNSKIK